MPKVLSQYDLSKIPVKGLVAESSPTAPSAPVGGQLWYDTSVNKLKAYQNGAWVILDLDTNTSYTTGTTAQIATGTDATAQVWTAANLKSAIVANSPVASVAGRTGVVVLAKADVGLSNVDNTADSAKPVSSAQQTALNAKADLASPTFTGDPKAPTPTAGDNDTSIATTAFVTTAVTPKANSANPTFTGTVTVPTPTVGTAAANKDYVDNAIQGLDAKQSVRAASAFLVGNLTLSGTQTVDGVALVAGDRVLVAYQTNGAQNGIYVVSAGAWSRAADADTWAELVGAFVFVEQGTSYGDTGWISTADPGGTLGTTAVNWVQFSSAGIVQAGAGLVKDGNTISIGTYAISSTMLANGSIKLNSAQMSGTLPVGFGGTGATTPTLARASLQANTSMGSTIPELIAGTWTALSNSVGLTLVADNFPSHVVRFYDSATWEEVFLDNRINSGSLQLEVKSDVAVAAGSLSWSMSAIG